MDGDLVFGLSTSLQGSSRGGKITNSNSHRATVQMIAYTTEKQALITDCRSSVSASPCLWQLETGAIMQPLPGDPAWRQTIKQSLELLQPCDTDVERSCSHSRDSGARCSLALLQGQRDHVAVGIDQFSGISVSQALAPAFLIDTGLRIELNSER